MHRHYQTGGEIPKSFPVIRWEFWIFFYSRDYLTKSPSIAAELMDVSVFALERVVKCHLRRDLKKRRQKSSKWTRLSWNAILSDLGAVLDLISAIPTSIASAQTSFATFLSVPFQHGRVSVPKAALAFASESDRTWEYRYNFLKMAILRPQGGFARIKKAGVWPHQLWKRRLMEI